MDLKNRSLDERLESLVERLLRMYLPRWCSEFEARNAAAGRVTTVGSRALFGLEADISEMKEAGIRFNDRLCNTKGGFYGNRAGSAVGCDYTYFGLLALSRLNP